jgi:CHAT domain-containing protein
MYGCTVGHEPLTLEEAKATKLEIQVVEKSSIRNTKHFLDSLMLNENSVRKCVISQAKGIESADYSRATGSGGIGTGEAQFVLGDPKQAISDYHAKMDRYHGHTYTTVSGTAPIYGKIASIHAYLGEVSYAKSALRSAYSNLYSNGSNRGGTASPLTMGAAYEAEGAIAEASGDLITAEAYYRKSIYHYSLFAPGFGGIARVALVRILMKTGNIGEAETLTQSVIKQGRGGAYHILILGLHVYTNLLYQNERYQDAIETARVAEYAYRLACGMPGNMYINDIRRIRAASLVALGKWNDALSVMSILDESMSSNPMDYERFFRGDPSRIIALIKTDNLSLARKEAEHALNAAQNLAGKTNHDPLVAKALIAMVDVAGMNYETALEGLTGIWNPLLENSDIDFNLAPAILESLGETFLILLSHIDESPLEQELRSKDATSTAFLVADSLRARVVREAIATAAARAQFTDPELDSLARKVDDIKNTVEGIKIAISRDLINPHAARSDKDINKLIAAENSFKIQLSDLQNKMKLKFPSYAELIKPITPSIVDTGNLLRNNETLISYYVGNYATYVWAISSQGSKLFYKIDLPKAKLNKLVLNVRESVEIKTGNLSGIQPFDLDSAHELYRLLFQPVENTLENTNSIIVVANKPLSKLPFSLLVKSKSNLTSLQPYFSEYIDIPWLARDYDITYLPSVSTLKALRGTTYRETSTDPFKGFGAPDFVGSKTFSGLMESDLSFTKRGKNTWMDAPVEAKLRVLDVQGKALDSQNNQIKSMAEINENGWIDLETNAQITLLHVGTSIEYFVNSPGRIFVQDTAVKRGGSVLTGQVSMSALGTTSDRNRPTPGVIVRGGPKHLSNIHDTSRLLGSRSEKIMVTGIAGNVSNSAGNPTQIFDIVTDNEPMTLRHNSMIEILHLGTYNDYSIKGPGTLILRENTLQFEGADTSTQDSVQISSSHPTDTEIASGLQMRAPSGTRTLNSAQLKDLQPLPDTALELVDMARALDAEPSASVFIGRQATEYKVKNTDLSRTNVLVFATHGLLPGDLDGLDEPALALSAPSIEHNEQDDGLLSMSEILGLRLNAQWVILSACNTAAANGVASEALSGLGRAFFYAGTRALLASHWPVETNSARLLTTELFKNQANDKGISRSRALQKSMLSLIDGPGYVDPVTNKTVFSYAHPLFWAPFTLIGEGSQSHVAN